MQRQKLTIKFRILRNRIHTDPHVWRAEATVELCEIGEILAEVLSKYATKKDKFTLELWNYFIDQATDINIELQLMRLENKICKFHSPRLY